MHQVRYYPLLLALACGGSPSAPVTVVLEKPDWLASGGVISVKLERKLNPACTASCELGAAKPDGGSLFSFDAFQRDAGVITWGPDEVLIGTTVIVSAEVGAAAQNCTASRELTAAGLEARVSEKIGGGAACSFR